MNVKEMCQLVAKGFKGAFHASDVQAKIGDGTKLVHISYVRAALGQLVKEGKLQVVGEGSHRCYAPAGIKVEVPVSKKATKGPSGQPRSNMRILDADLIQEIKDVTDKAMRGEIK